MSKADGRKPSLKRLGCRSGERVCDCNRERGVSVWLLPTANRHSIRFLKPAWSEASRLDRNRGAGLNSCDTCSMPLGNPSLVRSSTRCCSCPPSDEAKRRSGEAARRNGSKSNKQRQGGGSSRGHCRDRWGAADAGSTLVLALARHLLCFPLAIGSPARWYPCTFHLALHRFSVTSTYCDRMGCASTQGDSIQGKKPAKTRLEAAAMQRGEGDGALVPLVASRCVLRGLLRWRDVCCSSSRVRLRAESREERAAARAEQRAAERAQQLRRPAKSRALPSEHCDHRGNSGGGSRATQRSRDCSGSGAQTALLPSHRIAAAALRATLAGRSQIAKHAADTATDRAGGATQQHAKAQRRRAIRRTAAQLQRDATMECARSDPRTITHLLCLPSRPLLSFRGRRSRR